MEMEVRMPPGMLFRKMYCHQCGRKLRRKKRINTYYPGDPGFKRFVHGGLFINLLQYTVITYIYECPDCGSCITYEEQVKIARLQKQFRTKILKEKFEKYQ